MLWYVLPVTAAGVVLLAWLGFTGDFSRVAQRPVTFVVMAVLLFAGELRPIQIKRGSGSGGEIALSTSFIFALLLTVGLPAAALALAAASLLADTVQRKPPIKASFNAAQYVISVAGCGAVLAVISRGRDILAEPTLTAGDLGLVLAAGSVFFLLNGSLPSIAVALDQRVRPLTVLRRDFPYQLATAGVLVLTSPVIVVSAQHSVLLLPILLLPGLALHWSTGVSLEHERQSLHDSLTGLPNRALFHIKVTEALAGSSSAAIMLVDLDHFKEVNDTLGHRTGDKLLKQVGERLNTHLRHDATVARLGGDEFAILVPRVRAPQALETAGDVLESLNQPFMVDDFMLSVEASVGVAMYPEDGRESGPLLRCADVAMYQAKEGHKGCERYSVERDQHSRYRLALIGQVKEAMSRQEFVLHYQPKLDLRTGRVVGVEALVRWNHPELGLLPPGEFVPLIERTVHMSTFTPYVIELALTEVRRWRECGIPLEVAVNVPVNNLHDTGFVRRVSDLLAATETAPATLELEITESTIMADPERAMAVLHDLSAMGVRLSIDDFGKGYSSLSYLKKLPVDTLKIDKSFVMNMATDLDDERIVQSTIGLAKNLGLITIAEGVEDGITLQRLRALGCDLAQGYHIGRPIPGDDLFALLASTTLGALGPATPRQRARTLQQVR